MIENYAIIGLYYVKMAQESCKKKDTARRHEMSGKRKDYISWDEYFMSVAVLSSLRSKDPNTRVGACIVNAEKKIVGTGYNGFPIGCSDDELPWEREGEPLDTKYPYVCHAELNAILNSISRDLRGCVLYVVMFPCNECAKAIIQSGIKEVVYMINKYPKSDSVQASLRMLTEAGVEIRHFEKNEVIEIKI